MFRFRRCKDGLMLCSNKNSESRTAFLTLAAETLRLNGFYSAHLTETHFKQ